MKLMHTIFAKRYEILDNLGEGGMADVYLAFDTILKRDVAIKILRGSLSKDPITLMRFQREASAISKLSHPNVVDVYDVGEFKDHHYIVMEYVRGRTLKQLIAQRGALHKEEALDIMKQLTMAIQHAHEHNIIHRDVKPQNVLVKDDGTVKITDFGIAMVHDSLSLTQGESILGSAHYLAPETTRGEAPTKQVDIYALGIVFYELLSGTVPFKGDNAYQIATKHLHDPMPLIRDFNPTLPQTIENVIQRACVKDKNSRYTSTKEMLYDLEHCLDQGCEKVKPIVFENKPKPQEEVTIFSEHQEQPKKKRYKWILIILIVLCLGISIYLMLDSGIVKPKTIIMPTITDKSVDELKSELYALGVLDTSIRIEETLSDDKDKGELISIYPVSGKEVEKTSMITITVSKGKYYVIKDYTNKRYESVKKALEEEAPNIKIEVIKVASTSLKPGYIVEQSGLEEGQKIDPYQPLSITLTVTESVAFQIENMVGQKVEDIKQMLQDRGITPVLIQMEIPEDEEIEEGVVMRVEPQEGSWYVQEGSNTITLYYYE
ncbi:MAG: protein kinase [Longicatena sp.]|nr:protein kinase [Longicatena sp.]